MALRSDSWAEHCRTFNRHGGIGGLTAEIDALRAEVERLKEEVTQLGKAYELRLNDWHDLRAENERLRAALPQPTENLSLWQVRYREWREAGMPDESSQS